MDHQLQQIDSETSTINGTPRLLIGYYNNGSTTSREETKGFTSKYSTNFEKSFTIAPHHPQSHHENSSGNVCTNTSSIIHPTFVANENQTVRSSDDWDKPQQLNIECIQELTWWKNNITHWNGKSILPQTPQQTVYVDTSNSGWGCSLQLSNNNHQTGFRHWTHQEAQMSINWRELKTAFLALKTFPKLQNMRILIRTDNTTSMAYMNK
jgi:hypothetical protein